ncbi:MAG: hypothetical protein J6M60_03670 [Clostridia bacterium]|nr:hypothetical protein [Clostridia bacterium]
MIKVENYPNAFKEVYVILNHMSEEEVNLIPQNFMDMIKNNMDDEYEFELYDDMPFEDQVILQETKAILAYIFMNFWGTEEQKTKIKAKFEQDLIEAEEAKGKYNPDELFANKKKMTKIEENVDSLNTEENVQLVKYEKKNIFERIIDSIKKIFKNKK